MRQGEALSGFVGLAGSGSSDEWRYMAWSADSRSWSRGKLGAADMAQSWAMFNEVSTCAALHVVISNTG